MITAGDYFVPPHNDIEPPLPIQDLPDNSYNTQLESLFEGDPGEIYAEVAKLQAGWPSETRQWEHEPSESDLQNFDIKEGRQATPGLWTASSELGMLPRLRAMEEWNDKVAHTNPIFRPHCLSTRAQEAKFNLTPIANHGWYWWVHQEHLDKPYLVASKPGSVVTFELEVNVGIIKMYSLRSMSYGFGMVDCWIDNDVEHKVTVDGFRDNPDL